MKKKKPLSRIALLAEDRRLSEAGQEAVEEASRLKQELAARRKRNEIGVLLDTAARERSRICLWFGGSTPGDPLTSITGEIRRTPDGFFGEGKIPSHGTLKCRVSVARTFARPIPEGEITMIMSEGGDVLWQPK